MSDVTGQRSAIALSELVGVEANGLRSIRVEDDLGDEAAARSYVLTAQSRACLGRILLGLNETSHRRSWTLTGPFGSGKSFFSLYLMNLACSDQPGHDRALSQLSSVDPILADQLASGLDLPNSRGLFPVPVTGFRGPLQECLKHGFLRALDRLGSAGPLESLRNDVQAWSHETGSQTIIHWMDDFRSTVTAPSFNYHGILLVLDEMGKPLEYAASRSEQTDLYPLQAIAEFADRTAGSPVVFVGILHQAFERYAAMVSQTTQREWAKVQDRFEDVAFHEPPAEQTRLLARAVRIAQPDILVQQVPSLASMASEAITHGWCPALMDREEFQILCEMAYPFHPSALVVLPYVFRRLAQNERSMFAFLSSSEPFGFQEFIRKNSTPSFLRLYDLFDYIVANFQTRLYSSNRTRVLTETLERLNATVDLSELEIEILKTIGLLGWLGEVSPFQPSEELLLSALASDQASRTAICKALASLRKRSLVVFRQHNQAYAVWKGSDIDLDERMELAARQVSDAFSLADAVQHYLPPRPLVARRHSFQTGTLRFFEVRYADRSLLSETAVTPKAGASGLILLCLAANGSEVSDLAHWAEQPEWGGRDDVIFAVTKRTRRLNELLFDLRCWQWVQENTPELRDDAVAQRELFTRINSIEVFVQSELDQSVSLQRLSDSAGCVWIYKGHELLASGKEPISEILSRICDEKYQSSPIITNEMINRRLLSSQSAAARRNLIEAILTKSDLPQMGIEGYPPERSMYEGLFKKGGLHRRADSERWQLAEPPAEDPLKLWPAWQAIAEYIFVSPPEIRPVAELFRLLGDRPYGITDGLLPVLLCAFLQVHSADTTLYREGTLLPEPRVADWEVLLRRPELFSIAGCRVTGERAAIVERIARGLRTSPEVMPVVRELVRQLNNLPEYAWKTNRISGQAIALRKAVEQAHSPEKLLFNDLPLALSMRPFSDGPLDAGALEEFFQRLNLALTELATATPRRREWARDVFLGACELPEGQEGWQAFIEMSRQMAPNAQNSDLEPLVKRVAEAGDPATALEAALALIGNRPLRTWTDEDVDRFAQSARSMGRSFLKERENYLTGPTLTNEQELRADEISRIVLSYLAQYSEDPCVLETAIQKLLVYYRARSSEPRLQIDSE